MGSLFGAETHSPPMPDDDLPTLRVPIYLIGNARLGDDVVAALAQAVIESRKDLLSEFPLMAKLSAPNTEKNAPIPIHPGALTYFNGEQKSIFDKYGDMIFYGSMLLGSAVSLFAGTWRYITRPAESPANSPLGRLYALPRDIRLAGNDDELATIEQKIDRILASELPLAQQDSERMNMFHAMSIQAQRLDRMIERQSSRKALQA